MDEAGIKYLIHAELDIMDDRYAGLVEYLKQHDIFWSEEEVDASGWQV